ncbi:hypothetical protein BRX43_08285 [Sphingomonas sp. S-NIH.Pt15_0812]|nr:hypothetical protein BRX43_08285 [Sphingomonas sp. S-NIH.Pt15_0812]
MSKRIDDCEFAAAVPDCDSEMEDAISWSRRYQFWHSKTSIALAWSSNAGQAADAICALS